MNRLLFNGLITLGVVWLGLPAQAQTKLTVTTSTNAVPAPVSTPTMQPDTLQPNRPGMTMPQGDDRGTRLNRKQRRKNRTKSNTTNPNTTDYRPGAVGNGTASNNSNTTNYNSQNAIAPASGVNAVPPNPTSGSPTNPTGGAGTSNGSVSAGSTMGTSTQAGSTAVSKAPTPGPAADPDRISGPANRSRTLTISDFIAASPNYTTLQNALQTATLDKTLKGAGPFTVFAPTNEAFKKLPAQTQKVILEGRNLDALKTLLSYHAVAGELDAAELTRRIKAGGGKVMLQTVAGNPLTAQLGAGGRLELVDEQGNTQTIDAPDHYQSNGVVHGIGSVLMTKSGATAFR